MIVRSNVGQDKTPTTLCRKPCSLTQTNFNLRLHLPSGPRCSLNCTIALKMVNDKKLNAQCSYKRLSNENIFVRITLV